MEAQQKIAVERRIEEEERREKELPAPQGTHIKYVLLKLSAENSPVHYMNQMGQYWRSVKPKKSDMVYLIKTLLSAPAGDRFQIIKYCLTSFDEFMLELKQGYWNDQAQHKIRRNLKFGFYTNERKIHRAEYAIKIDAEVQKLDPPPTPVEIVQKLS